jgi:hypothetical protein
MARHQRRAAYATPLPNVGSERQTPASLAIDVHYAKLQLVERWQWERFVRLCKFLRLTPAELASLVLLPHRYLCGYEKQNTLPLYYSHAQSVALTLTLLESHLCGEVTKDVISNPFPKL